MRLTEPYTVFLRKLQSGRKVYYYQYRRNDGTRSVPKSTGCTNRTKALRYCQFLYSNNKFDVDVVDVSIKFNKFCKDFFGENGEFRTWKRTNGADLKADTVRRYELSLDKHIVPFFKNTDIRDITKDRCKKWVVWASEKLGLSPKSVNNAQGVLNLVFESAIDKGLIKVNPLRGIGLRKLEKKKKDLLTVEELAKIYRGHWANETEKRAFLLASITGMRIGEVCALQKSDIKKNYLDVTKSYSGKFGMQNSTKTGMSRCVPYPADFDFSFVHADAVFTEDGANPVKPHCVYNAFTRNMDRIGINRKERGINLHSLRNCFISYLRAENIPDPKIRAVVGHADESMTDLYTYWTPDMFPEVYEKQKKLYYAIIGKE